MTTPCELGVTAHYPDKDATKLKSSIKYINSVRENITDRGVLRSFIDSFSKARGLEVGLKLLTELDTLGKYALNVDKILHKQWGGDHIQAALSLMEQTSSVVKGSGINVEGLTQTKQKAYWGSVNRDIEAIGFAREFRSGVFDVPIREVIFSGKKYEGVGADKINQTASILRRHYSIINKELNGAGLRVAYVSNYSGAMTHDGSSIYGNKLEWFKSLDKHLQFHKEFPEVPTRDIIEFQNMIKSGEALPETATNKVHQILDYSYKKITAEESMLHDEVPSSLATTVSIAERRSRARSFTTWKSGESVQSYLNQFGKHKTLASQMQNYSHMAAKDIGLVTIFGASPKKGFDMVKTLTSRQLKLQGKTDLEISHSIKQLDIAWNGLIRPKIPPPTKVGSFLMDVRTIAAQAKLGTAGITSIIMDPAATAVQHRNLMQEGFISSMFNTAKFYIPSLLESAMHGGNSLSDSYLFSNHDIMTSHEELSAMNGGSWLSGKLRQSGEFISKASGAYYFNKTAHIVNAKMYLTYLADAANGKKINNIMMADLGKFGITQHEVNITAKLGLNTKNGMRNIFRMDVHEFMELNPEMSDPIKAEHQLASYKERMGQWLLHKIKSGAPIPGNRERRILLGDTTPGSLEGEARRFLMQFKATQTKVFLDTTIGAARRLDPSGIQGGKVNWTNKESLYNMGAVFGSFTAAGALNILINAAITGDKETLRRFQERDISLLPEAMARGGAAGAPGDLLSWKSNKAELGAQLLISPATGALLQPFVSAKTAMEGNPAKGALDLAKTYVPGANLFFLKPFVQGMTDAAANHTHHSSNFKSSGL
jgi:hypothetical protein